MNTSLVYLLLFCGLVLPVVGALGVRFFAERLGPAPITIITGILVIVSIISVLVLSQSNVTQLSIGQLNLFLPDALPSGRQPVPPQILEQPNVLVPDNPSSPATTPTTATVTATPTGTTTPSPTPPNIATVIPSPTLTPTDEPTPTAEPTPTPESANEPFLYTVQEGDTLSEIAAEFDITVEELLAANNLSEEDAATIRPGDELLIPAPTTDTTDETSENAEPESAQRYIVQEGDTLGGIAEEFGVSVDALLAANDLTPEEATTIRPGEEIIIP